MSFNLDVNNVVHLGTELITIYTACVGRLWKSYMKKKDIVVTIKQHRTHRVLQICLYKVNTVNDITARSSNMKFRRKEELYL